MSASGKIILIELMKTEKEKMIDGDYYFSNDKQLVAERQKTKKILFELNFVLNQSNKNILQQLLPNSSKQIYIETPFHCDYGYNIICGKNVYFNTNCVVLDAGIVNIGDNVLIGPNTQIYTSTHPLNAIERLKFQFTKPITIGNDCWIGGNVVICPGVTIGSRSVIGAGSVVTKDIPSGVLAAGNPAKVIRKLG